jgi:hypothetical protein
MRFLFPVAALTTALMPLPASGQGRLGARSDVVWHWFGTCASRDSVTLEVSFDGKAVFTAAVPMCQLRRGDIKPESQQRLLAFRFSGAPRRFGYRDKSTEPQSITCNIWEARRERDGVRLGVSLATEQQVLYNMAHIASVHSPSRSEQIRGLVITTRPVRRPDKTPPAKRLKTDTAK